ncbi:hypothetical protein JCM3765_006918 [Sporobolomyces pararoseus]
MMTDAPLDHSSSTRTTLFQQPDAAISVKIKPLKAVLGSLPRIPFPPHDSHRGKAGESIKQQVKTSIPSSSTRSTIQKASTISIANHSRPGSSNLLPPITSPPSLPSTGSLLRPSMQAQSVPGFNTLSFSTPPPNHYSAPSPLRSRPPAELEWFSPPVKSKPSPYCHQIGVGGGSQLETSSSSRPMGRRLSSISSQVVRPTGDASSSLSLSRGVIVNNIHKRPRIDDCSSSFSSAPVNSRTIYKPIEQARQKRHPWRSSNGEDTDATLRMHSQQGFVRPTEIAKPAATQAQYASPLSGGTGDMGGAMYTTLWEDELTVVLSVEVNGNPVARRIDNNWINCTKLLNAAGLTRGRKDTILKSEEHRQVFRRGASNLKGVWLPYEAALRLAGQYGLLNQLYSLFAPNILTWLFTPLNLARTVEFTQACRDRSILKPGDGDLHKLLVARQGVGLVSMDRLSANAEMDCLRRRKEYLLTFLASLEMGLRSLGPIVSQVVVNHKAQSSRTVNHKAQSSLAVAQPPLAQIQEAQEEEEEQQHQAAETSRTNRQTDEERPRQSVRRLPTSVLAGIRSNSSSSPVGDNSLPAQLPGLTSNEPSTSYTPSSLPPIRAHDWFDNPPPVSIYSYSPELIPSTPRRRSLVSNQPDQPFVENNDKSSTPPPSVGSILPRHLAQPSVSPSSPTNDTTIPRSRSTSARSLLFDSNSAPSPSSSAWNTTAPASRASTVAPLSALDAVALALERDFPEWNAGRDRAGTDDEKEEEEESEGRPSKRYRLGVRHQENIPVERRQEQERESRTLRERKEVKNYCETSQSGKSKTRPQMRGKR